LPLYFVKRMTSRVFDAREMTLNPVLSNDWAKPMKAKTSGTVSFRAIIG